MTLNHTQRAKFELNFEKIIYTDCFRVLAYIVIKSSIRIKNNWFSIFTNIRDRKREFIDLCKPVCIELVEAFKFIDLAFVWRLLRIIEG